LLVAVHDGAAVAQKRAMVQSLNRRQDLLNSSAHSGDNSNGNSNLEKGSNNGTNSSSNGGLVSMDLSSVGLGAGQCSSGVSALASALAGRRLGTLQHLALDGNQLAAHDGALLGEAIARSYRSAHAAHVREAKGEGDSGLGNGSTTVSGSATQSVAARHVEASKDNDDTSGSVLWCVIFTTIFFLLQCATFCCVVPRPFASPPTPPPLRFLLCSSFVFLCVGRLQ